MKSILKLVFFLIIMITVSSWSVQVVNSNKNTARGLNHPITHHLNGAEVDVQAPSKQEQFFLRVQACNQAFASNKPQKCSLFGKIKVVDSFPDVKIQKVDSFPDIKVKWVRSFPDKPGLWKKVDSFPDFKIQFVKSFPDYKVKFVDSFPGCK